jgi:hypothetical protein
MVKKEEENAILKKWRKGKIQLSMETLRTLEKTYNSLLPSSCNYS